MAGNKPGKLEFSWNHGGIPRSLCYVEDNKFCFPCGHCIKVLSENTEPVTYSEFEDDILLLTASPNENVIAIIEHYLNPNIFILSYPNFEKVRELKGDSSSPEEYLALQFLQELLLSVTGCPDFSFILWNWKTGDQLTSVSCPLLQSSSTHVTPNPLNSQQCCLIQSSCVIIGEVQKCGEEFSFRLKTVTLPSTSRTNPGDSENVDVSLDKDDCRLDLTTEILSKLSLGPVTKMSEQELEEFQLWCAGQTLVVPRCHCWTANGDVLVACDSGLIIRVNGESAVVTECHQLQWIESQEDKTGSEENCHVVSSIALHRDGLFIGGRVKSFSVKFKISAHFKLKTQ
ncbi:cilia- and flagella-associated protein 43-like, partial [Limulus polyphemus]|uniref:Cilia- and flagella-associated protein 43 n=1 Tax=Limulus polyphemus TaxID=6850 RepID=A0ABM1TS86_LIMPO